MQYRTFGKLDWQPSALGFGAMRLPILNGDSAQIDEPLATAMIRYAIDHGVTYVDTAWPYHKGTSEPFLAKALADGYRAKVKLATKMPTWLVKSLDDCDSYLDQQLERLQTDTIDFYLLHALHAERWHTLRDLNVTAWAEKQIASGKIRHIGFSFHDRYEAFQEIIDDYDGWDFCQIQYNFMDVNEQAGTKGLHYAADKGLGVVIMEPLRGGKLAKNPPPPAVAALWEQASIKRTPADWALQWLWNQPEISLILSGMSTLQQVEENVASAERSRMNSFSAEELALVDQARTTYQSLMPIPCTACEYCLPCPQGVAIPRIFGVYNEAIMYDDVNGARDAYLNWLDVKERADLCVECRQCEEQCPQAIEITDWLKKAHAMLMAS